MTRLLATGPYSHIAEDYSIVCPTDLQLFPLQFPVPGDCGVTDLTTYHDLLQLIHYRCRDRTCYRLQLDVPHGLTLHHTLVVHLPVAFHLIHSVT